jgi:hypothetical protein
LVSDPKCLEVWGTGGTVLTLLSSYLSPALVNCWVTWGCAAEFAASSGVPWEVRRLSLRRLAQPTVGRLLLIRTRG